MKKILAVILALVMLLCVMTACAGKQASSGSRESLVIAEEDEWWGLDTTQLDGTSYTQDLVGDSLVMLDTDGNMVPCIASEVVVSEDGKTITLTIPSGMKFASGEELLPEDVVASLERAKTAGPFGSEFEPIESMDIDGDKVTLHLTEFTTSMADALSGPCATVMDKDVIDVKTNEELLWDCQPYGMYYMTEYVSGSHVVLTRNDGYVTHNPFVENKGPAHIPTVTIRFIAEEFSKVSAFNVDDVQVMMTVTPEGLTQVTREDITVEKNMSIPNINYIEFNLDHPLLSDVRLRQAICLAIDRAALSEINSGMIIPAYSIATESVRNYSAEFAAYYKENYCDDLERAKGLLAEMGYTDTDGNGFVDKDGQDLHLVLTTSDWSRDALTAQSLQLQMKDLGIDLELEILDGNYRYEKIGNGEFELGFQYFGSPEPIRLMNWLLLGPYNLDLTAEIGFYDVITNASCSLDTDERTKLIGDAEKMLSDDCITVPLYSVLSIKVFAKDVTGIVNLPDGTVLFNDMK